MCASMQLADAASSSRLAPSPRGGPFGSLNNFYRQYQHLMPALTACTQGKCTQHGKPRRCVEEKHRSNDCRNNNSDHDQCAGAHARQLHARRTPKDENPPQKIFACAPQDRGQHQTAERRPRRFAVVPICCLQSCCIPKRTKHSKNAGGGEQAAQGLAQGARGKATQEKRYEAGSAMSQLEFFGASRIVPDRLT